jgi:hypothetical protein
MNKTHAFHAAVRQFVVSWADLEYGLDLLMLLTRARGQKAPHQLSGKICFLRQQAEALPHLQEHKKPIVALLGEVERL